MIATAGEQVAVVDQGARREKPEPQVNHDVWRAYASKDGVGDRWEAVGYLVTHAGYTDRLISFVWFYSASEDASALEHAFRIARNPSSIGSYYDFRAMGRRGEQPIPAWVYSLQLESLDPVKYPGRFRVNPFDYERFISMLRQYVAINSDDGNMTQFGNGCIEINASDLVDHDDIGGVSSNATISRHDYLKPRERAALRDML